MNKLYVYNSTLNNNYVTSYLMYEDKKFLGKDTIEIKNTTDSRFNFISILSPLLLMKSLSKFNKLVMYHSDKDFVNFMNNKSYLSIDDPKNIDLVTNFISSTKNINYEINYFDSVT